MEVITDNLFLSSETYLHCAVCTLNAPHAWSAEMFSYPPCKFFTDTSLAPYGVVLDPHDKGLVLVTI